MDASDLPAVQLRYALIGGAASIAASHIAALRQLPGAQIVGLSDVAGERGAARAHELGCPFFENHNAMLAELRPDVAVICTPHPSHAALTIDALRAGAHVLVEKPLAVEVAEADAMIAAADAAGRLLAVNLQHRFRPVVERARTLIDEGEIGPLVRTLCVEPTYRTAAYYRSAGWRGTWRGEGGGVLLNQAPHPLDLLCWLAGMPARVWGWARTRAHTIECEDTAQALLEYPNGAPGYVYFSTAEPDELGRLEIVGERGALVIAGDDLTTLRYTPSLPEHLARCPELWDVPDATISAQTVSGDGGGHLAVHRDLAEAIAKGRPPRADGCEARKSLELANAIILSSHLERPVDLPLDRAAYGALLARLRGGV
jgi:predicted dehydrogenase